MPSVGERLYNISAARKSQQSVDLLFLVDKRKKIKEGTILLVFMVDGKYEYYRNHCFYNELWYRVGPIELRMEFYLEVFNLFCKSGDRTLTISGGSKPIMVRVKLERMEVLSVLARTMDKFDFILPNHMLVVLDKGLKEVDPRRARKARKDRSAIVRNDMGWQNCLTQRIKKNKEWPQSQSLVEHECDAMKETNDLLPFESRDGTAVEVTDLTIQTTSRILFSDDEDTSIDSIDIEETLI